MSLWFLFYKGKNKILQRPLLFLTVLLVLPIGLYISSDFVLSKTYLGKRLEDRHMEHSAEMRWQMYIDGFNMIKKHPFVGVGLNNYQFSATRRGTYSHSDYIEVTANTGIVGFMLHYSIYMFLWLRLNRIKLMTSNSNILYTIGLLKAVIITMFLLATGNPNITFKLTWLFLASAIGYSWSIERALLSNKRMRMFEKVNKLKQL